MRLLRACLSFSVSLLHRPRKPSRVRTRRRQFEDSSFHLTPVQVTRIIRAANTTRDRTIIRLFAETGIRRAELANLLIDDIRLKERLLVIRHGKGDKTRVVPMTSHVVAQLAAITQDRTSGFVFPGRANAPLSLRQINHIVADAGRRAGVRHPNPSRDRINCHLFRHTFARLWKDRNGDLETLAAILGHASVTTSIQMYGTVGLSELTRNFSKVMKAQLE